MGKFVKKGKITGDVAVMEVPQATLGVRTRAKTLALQQNPDLCYLQLRSRRLEKPQFLRRREEEVVEAEDFGAEASFGETNFDFDQPGRGTRESTPCSLIREFESNGTPGSAVRSTCSSAVCRRQSRSSTQRSNSFTLEMEEFFAGAEMQQQKHFLDKYNFDIENGLPLSGRYEWVRIDS